MHHISPTRSSLNAGFTLIELSIVLVIIGLITGGVLVGQDLITAAKIRSQISAIESYNTAANTFRTKYNAIPGDMLATEAAKLGLLSRNGTVGCGDGNGLVASFFASDGNVIALADFNAERNCFGNGGEESQIFWNDLSTAGYVSGIENTGDPSGADYTDILPRTKVGNGFVVATHGGMVNVGGGGFGYYLIGYDGEPGDMQFDVIGDAFPALSTSEAYAIDSKMDDGNAIGGNVYTLDSVPGFGTTSVRGVMAGCATVTSGVGVYDMATPAKDVCMLKIKGSI